MKNDQLQMLECPASSRGKITWFYNQDINYIQEKLKEHKESNLSDDVWEWAYNLEHNKI